jgi:hypothetical protein
MSLDAPWIRWAIDWHLSPMMQDASSDEKVAWFGIVCQCKAVGVRGRFRIDRRGLAASHNIPLSAVDSMVERALKGRAMRAVEERFELCNWERYQPPSTERTRAFRAKETQTDDEKPHSDGKQGVPETGKRFRNEGNMTGTGTGTGTGTNTSEAAGAASPPTRPKRRSEPKYPSDDPNIWGKGEIRFDVGGRRWVGITDDTIRAWSAAYPAVDLDAALARAAVWCAENPAKGRKSQYGRFLSGWFSRDQDRTGYAQPYANGTNGTHKPEADEKEIVRLYEERERERKEKLRCLQQTLER